MAFVQQVEDCDEHEDCTVISKGPADEVGSWRSHMHSDIHADHRIDPDIPAKCGTKAIKQTEPCVDCIAHPAWQALHPAS